MTFQQTLQQYLTTTGDPFSNPDDGNVNVDATGAMKLPVGTTAQQDHCLSGQMRSHPDTNSAPRI